MFDYIIAEPICEHLAWQRWDRDASRLSLKYITEIFEIGVAATNHGVFEFEGGNIRFAEDLVCGVHTPTGTVRLRIFDLETLNVRTKSSYW